MVMGKSRRGVGLVESGVERPDQRRDLGQPLLRTGWAKEKKKWLGLGEWAMEKSSDWLAGWSVQHGDALRSSGR